MRADRKKWEKLPKKAPTFEKKVKAKAYSTFPWIDPSNRLAHFFLAMTHDVQAASKSSITLLESREISSPFMSLASFIA